MTFVISKTSVLYVCMYVCLLNFSTATMQTKAQKHIKD